MMKEGRECIERLDLLVPSTEIKNEKYIKNHILYFLLLVVVAVVSASVGIMVGRFVFSSSIHNAFKKAAQDIDGDFEFANFMSTYGKQYEKYSEYAYRKSIWKSNVKHIEEQNARGLSYTLKMNKFGDLQLNEFKQKMLGYSKHKELKSQYAEVKSFSNFKSGNLPESVDWRKSGCVTPIKDQGQCGSCWAFSTTGSIESAVCIATGKLYSLSEQQLVDCDSPPNSGCSGGLMEFAFQYVVMNKGLCTETAYPYKATEQDCNVNCDSVAPIRGFSMVQSKNSTALKEALALQGPVSVAINAEDADFMFYESGVYNRPCGVELNHGVLVVGYGTESETNEDYWIVKNSWGPEWGLEGYVLMSQKGGDGECGILLDMSYPIL